MWWSEKCSGWLASGRSIRQRAKRKPAHQEAVSQVCNRLLAVGAGGGLVHAGKGGLHLAPQLRDLGAVAGRLRQQCRKGVQVLRAAGLRRAGSGSTPISSTSGRCGMRRRQPLAAPYPGTVGQWDSGTELSAACAANPHTVSWTAGAAQALETASKSLVA